MEHNNVVELAFQVYAKQRGLEIGRGAQKAFAKECGVTRNTIRNWVRKNSVSLEHVGLVNRLTGFPKSILNQKLRELEASTKEIQ